MAAPPEPTTDDLAAMAELAPGESKVVRTETSLVQYHVFDQRWEVVIAAHEMRYPTHPDLPLMVSSEVVSRDNSQESEGKEIFTRKVVVKNSSVPRMLSTLAGGDTMEFEETYLYDRPARRAFKTGRNLSFREGRWGIRLDETMQYIAHRDTPDWTWFKLEAILTLPSLPGGLGSTAQLFFADLYIDGVGRGRKIDQKFVDEIVQSGRLGNDEFKPWGTRGRDTTNDEDEDEDEEEQAWDSGTETDITSYEDAREGPSAWTSAVVQGPDDSPGIELAALVAELRDLKQVLTEVTQRLDAIGLLGNTTEVASHSCANLQSTVDLRAGQPEPTAAPSWQWECCAATAVGVGLVGIISWRHVNWPPWLLSKYSPNI